MTDKIVTLRVVDRRSRILDETHSWVGHNLGGTCEECGADVDDESTVCTAVPEETATDITRYLDEGRFEVAQELVARRAWEGNKL